MAPRTLYPLSISINAMINVALPLIPGTKTGPNFNPARVATQKAWFAFLRGKFQANFMKCQGAVNPWVGKTKPIKVSDPPVISVGFLLSIDKMRGSKPISSAIFPIQEEAR